MNCFLQFQERQKLFNQCKERIKIITYQVKKQLFTQKGRVEEDD